MELAAICMNCKKRSAGPGGGCFYGKSEELPMLCNPTQKCKITDEDGNLGFEPDTAKLKHGKLIVGYETDPSPGKEHRISAPPKHTGYSDAVIEVDGNPIVIRLKGDKCYSANDELKYLGTVDELFPPAATEAEMDRKIREVRDSQMKRFNH